MRKPAILTRRQPSRSARSSLATGHWKLATIPAFTLTEVLISLAMVSILLIGISRIFALTSQTIGTGQALSTAVRTQRSVSQTISDDILGPMTATPNDPNEYNGMMRLNERGDVNAGAPFLTISNFRVPTYLNGNALAADANAPANITTITAADYQARSKLIRGIDSNNDGVETQTSISAGGEIIPIYSYGERNFRCDTIGFFAKGQFHSQTGVSVLASGSSTPSSFIGDVSSTEAFIWYGHMRVFNGTANRLDYANAYGAPGDWVTQSTPSLPNTNHRFAEQFVLGRSQFLLVEPTDHDQRVGSGTWTTAQGGEDRKLAENNTVIASGDPSKPAIFVQRNWWQPEGDFLSSRAIFSPFTITDAVKIYRPDTATSATGTNKTLYTDDRAEGYSPKSGVSYQAASGRTDIVGVGSPNARRRARFLQQHDIDVPPTAAQGEWWESLTTSWNRRYWCNPFVSTTPFDTTEPNINAKSLAQRQQVLTEGCSQFIVEFAGDFVTQNNSTSGTYGTVTRALPDGVLDFVVLPDGSRRTRWYGLPRDADGNGVISTRANDAITSEDVLPVSVYAGNGFVTAANLVIYGSTSPSKNNSWLPFERIPLNGRGPTSTVAVAPTSNNDYMTNIDEPANATSPDKSSYVCVWGAQDFERTYPDPVDPTQTLHGAVPQLLRLIIDQSDPKQKLKTPVTQELIFPVPNVTGDARR